MIEVTKTGGISRTRSGTYSVLAPDIFTINHNLTLQGWGAWTLGSPLATAFLRARSGKIINTRTINLDNLGVMTVNSVGADYGVIDNQSLININDGGLLELVGHGSLNNLNMGRVFVFAGGALADLDGTSSAILNNAGLLDFSANALFLLRGTPPMIINNTGNIKITLPLAGGTLSAHIASPKGLLDLVRVTNNLAASTFTLQSATPETIPALAFKTGGVAGSIINIGGGAGTITMAGVNAEGSNLNLKGNLNFSASATMTNAPAVTLTGAIKLAAGAVLTNGTGTSTANATGAVFDLASCPTSAVPVPIVAVASSATMTVGAAKFSCPGFSGVVDLVGTTGIEARFSKMVTNSVTAVPANAPVGLGLTALALAVLGARRIKKALGA